MFAIGTGYTLLAAAITRLFLPYEEATDEKRAHLQPKLLELGVGVVTRIAAYVDSRENLQKSLTEVAIGVALLPPACVVGIGWLDWSVSTESIDAGDIATLRDIISGHLEQPIALDVSRRFVR